MDKKSIIQWNCRGLKANYNEILILTTLLSPTVFCLQETFLKNTDTVVTAFFMSTETHAKRFLTVWKRSVSTTFKRSFTVLANQIIVSETFQAFQILTNHISVRKTLSWKPCLVSNVLAFAELANQNPADSIYFTSFFFYFQFHLIIIVIKLIKIIVK